MRLPKACVFCGRADTPLTREHVWPNWCSSAFPEIAESVGAFLDDGQGNRRAWGAGTFDHTTRSVCAACNNGWMSDLESAAKPLLLAMIPGRMIKLGPARTRTLATWAFKTALMHDQARPGPATIPASHYTALYEDRRPPDQVAIWTGKSTPRLVDDTVLVTESRIQELTLAPGAPPEEVRMRKGWQSYGVSLALGYCLFQIMGTNVPGLGVVSGTIPAQPVRRRLRQLWPSTGRRTWPPPERLDDIGGILGVRDAFIPRGRIADRAD